MAQFGRAKQEPAFSIVTSVALGEFEANQSLTKPMDIAEYLRLGMQESDPDFDLDDDAILAVAKSIPQGDDWETQVADALLSKTRSNAPREPQVLPDLTPVTISRDASSIHYAQLLDANENFRNTLHIAGEVAVTMKRAAFLIFVAALQTLGYKINNAGILDTFEGELINWPVPGTHPVNAEGKFDRKWRPRSKADANKFAEYYKSAGDKFDWYADLVEHTTEGKALRTLYNEYDNGLQRKGKAARPRTGRFANEPNDWLQGEKATTNMRLQNMTRSLKVAVNAFLQMKAIHEHPVMKTKVEVSFVMRHSGKEGQSWDNITDSTHVIVIADKTKRAGSFQAYTMSGFNNLDVEGAAAKGGTVDDLMNSITRDTEKPETDAIAWDKDVFLNNVSQLAEWLIQVRSTSEILKACEARDDMGVRTENAELLIDSMFSIMDAVHTVCDKYKGETYQRILLNIGKRKDAKADGAVERATKVA